MGYLRYAGLVLILGVMGMSLTACSSDSGAGVAPASYSGNMSQASVTTDNGDDLGQAAIDGAGSGLGGVTANAVSGGSTENKAQLLGLVRTITSTLSGQNISDTTAGMAMNAAATSNSDTVTGDCGGSYTYSYTYDSATGAYTNTSTFNDYVSCHDKSVLSGTMTYTGIYNEFSMFFPSLKMEFSALTYKLGVESITMTGSFDLAASSAYIFSITMNMDFRDNINNETFRLENYLVSAVVDLSETFGDYYFSGTVYHSVHGYVTVSTPTVIRGYSTDDYPSSGVMKLVGSGNSSVIVTFTSGDTYTLEIDNDGDTVIDTTKNCTWSTGTCI